MSNVTVPQGSAKIHSERSLHGLCAENEPVGKEVQTMHRAKQVWQLTISLAARTWHQVLPLVMKPASLLKKAKSRQAHGMIPPAGVLIGALAFGWWWQNFAAALFAGIGLFFLAGIYKTTERMLATSRRSQGEPHSGDRAAHSLPEPTPENSDAVNEAIGSLKPWVTDEVLLTEENAKQCCAVLLDSVASRARATTSF
jgi:hypothetical protein